MRRANLRRVVGLFRPYRARLTLVLVLIALSAGIGMISPFLLRDVLDNAIPEQNTALLTALVAGMIAIAIVTGALGVVQTYVSNVVGQQVMHDLRSAVYRHLQRLSLAFFTRTRTGEVQSRIANDIGGVDTVVTSTATSIVSNLTTVIAAVVAMFLLDWRLAVFALGLLPLFVWLSRRVGNQRRVITMSRQRTLADISTLVEESLSVSGVLLGKTMGRSPELADRFTQESARLADLEVRQRMAGRWVMATIQMTFAIMPAAIYWFAGPDLDRRRHGHLDRHGGGLHHHPGAHVLPGRPAALGGDRHPDLARAVRPGLRVPRPPGRDRRAPGRAAPARAARTAGR